MQEEVENRTLTLVVSGTKLTGRLFKAAIAGGNARNIRSVLRTAIQQSFPWIQTQ